MANDLPPDQKTNEDYRVLARKYRPQTFAELIGQEAMVRTLKNAIAINRIAHAFMLTGVRGVGKTTTARLIAKALNCVGPDGLGTETVSPCGVCPFCVAIAEGKGVDVIEMDAASHTSVNDVREITEGVRYTNQAARYRVFIIDEVHMLSRQAFNALLKTLEEPPGHVKFILATTEIRKVPITVLSRCQRFDLKRIPVPILIDHFATIAKSEAISIDQESLSIIARAADGSVRDGLSMLDQAIAHGGNDVKAETTRAMLGLADRSRVMALVDAATDGKPAEAAQLLLDQYDQGADPVMLIGDMLDIVHLATRFQVVQSAQNDPALSAVEREGAARLADRLTMMALNRLWQMLLKGHAEVRDAARPIAAAEMLIYRIAYASNLPDPAALIRTLETNSQAPELPTQKPERKERPADTPISTVEESTTSAELDPPSHAPDNDDEMSMVAGPGETPIAPEPVQHLPTNVIPLHQGKEVDRRTTPSQTAPQTPDAALKLLIEDIGTRGLEGGEGLTFFACVVALFTHHLESRLAFDLTDNVKFRSFRIKDGRYHLRLAALAALGPDFGRRIARLLREWTGAEWVVEIEPASKETALLSLREVEDREAEAFRQRALAHPLVKAVFETFPDARLHEIKPAASGQLPTPAKNGTKGDLKS
ncbi:MAG: DNA polymerase III subunit gamma/tau [Pseudomonadota bacterium]